MSARDLVLGRLRAALASGAHAPVEVPRDYRHTGTLDLDQLVERLTDYRAHVHRVVEAAVADTIADILPAGGTVVVPPGLPPAWLPPTVTALPDDGLDNMRIGAADAVVTGAAVAVAQTGTVVLDGSPDQGRRVLSLLPDRHVCVLRADQVVATVPEALARLTPHRPLTWISGPSATSDIELIRVEGVHGPRQLHVILLPYRE
ncbi:MULTISPECIES: LUD domain-containing protein [unclassified Micromonospora]|uniref:LutC/YkgG family protein n=1 Tax=unclassified Micromonospora TaxID=2617518 RepID=UPI001788A909|nr:MULTISPECIES: LUD domain-containing protein [unclassified Micromonospora]MDG4758090.1 LUD domain-containing protein [Micromonospora sp. WMMD710]